MRRLVLLNSLAIIWSVGVAGPTQAQDSTSTVRDWLTGYPYYDGSYHYPSTQSNRQTLPSQKSQSNQPTQPTRQNPTAPYQVRNRFGEATSMPTLFNPDYVVGRYGVQVVALNTPNIYAPRQYDYVPVPDYRNGLSSSLPTIFNPDYVAGKYGVQAVARNTPNIYAPRQYDYVPVPDLRSNGLSASAPTVLNPNYVVGKYDLKVVPHGSPNIYAPKQYDLVPVPKR